VRLTAGGPDWETRQATKNPPQRPSKKQRATQRALGAYLFALEDALRRGDLKEARAMRAAAWDQVGLLPPHLTWEQRRTLGKFKVLLRAAEQQARQRRAR
jgi:hypothetical protein